MVNIVFLWLGQIRWMYRYVLFVSNNHSIQRPLHSVSQYINFAMLYQCCVQFCGLYIPQKLLNANAFFEWFFKLLTILATKVVNAQGTLRASKLFFRKWPSCSLLLFCLDSVLTRQFRYPRLRTNDSSTCFVHSSHRVKSFLLLLSRRQSDIFTLHVPLQVKKLFCWSHGLQPFRFASRLKY